MKRSALLVASVVVGMLTLAGPASAAPSYYRTYPSHDLAAKACEVGKKEGRWTSCSYRPAEPGPNPPVQLWVA
ncbi:hypothetical protein GCM10027271_08530 [Saccharopolyspora gloriosae]|uniref:Uncharacterized protein n=1 Tax=Saccharopolyspora gloriosae TaxID=455344 RepID=A0A840NMS6_9PSEU|nr:hypothetical protein [Saccharopolyspora gloriosae]MBB5072401.1 hypothetical protein [Saccharopolyspora gloriosae]